MPSPFPGMDPYLEHPAFWTEFHHRFLDAWSESLAASLPDEFEAGLGERVYLTDYDPETRKLIYPDVAVSEESPRDVSGSRSAAVATLEPITVPLAFLGGPREAYIEILHRPDRRLVAVLELLSPGNKVEPGRTEYLSKREALLHQDVHLIELDLLKGGRRLPMGGPLPPGDYYYLLSRAEERPNSRVYAWTVRDRLPTLPVPLLPPHDDVPTNLAEVLALTYDRGRFGKRLLYREPCPAPFDPDAARWAEGIGREKA